LRLLADIHERTGRHRRIAPASILVEHGARLIEPCQLGPERRFARGPDAAVSDAKRRQPLVGIVGTQHQPLIHAAG